MRATLGVLLGVALFTASAAFGQQPECSADIEKFCKGVKAGEGLILKCLREHEAQVSADCKAQLNTAAVHMACIDDGIRLCPGLEPSWGGLIKCLRTHMNDLSTPCRNELRRP